MDGELATSRKTEWRSRANIFVALLLISATILSGCQNTVNYVKNGFKVGPKYGRPDAAVAHDWIDQKNSHLLRQQTCSPQWWATFEDPVLSDLIFTGYQQNLSLRVAGNRILEARATRGIAVGGLFPQTQRAFADYSYNLRSLQGVNIPTATRNFNIYDGGLNLSWELDFWGRYRRLIEAADAQLDASIEGYDAAIVTLLSDIADAYIRIRTQQYRLVLARANVEALKGSYEIANARFKAGASSELDVLQAQQILSQTEALIPNLEIDLRQANNRLCVLLGRPPEDMVVKMPEGKIPMPSADVCVGMPAELLRQRPDVRQAERLLAAQCARIGVAESALYPQFTINGTLGSSARSWSGLFESNAHFGSVGPAINWNILNYGRLRNAIQVEDARFQQMALQYELLVLTADREVEDAIVGYYQSRERMLALQKGTDASEKSSNLILTLYREGKVDYNRVFTVLSTLVIQQDLLAQATGELNLQLVALYRALGGGWQIKDMQPASGKCWCEGCECLHLGCCDDYCKKPCPPCPACGPNLMSYPAPGLQGPELIEGPPLVK